MAEDLTSMETRLAERYVSVLDFVSRCALAVDEGNWHYLWDKAGQLAHAADVPNPGLLSGSDAYDAVGGLYLLTSRLPQLCRQLAAVLSAAAGHGTLTGPHGAPERAAAQLRQAAATLTTAYQQLDAANQTLGPVGGWLSPDAQALGIKDGA